MAKQTYAEIMVGRGADPRLMDTSTRLAEAIRAFSAELKAIDPTILSVMIYRDEDKVPGQVEGIWLNRSAKIEAARQDAIERAKKGDA